MGANGKIVSSGGGLVLRLATDPADLRAAQRLRYRVFVDEMGGGGAGVCHADKLESDRYDAFVDHLILSDPARAEGDHVIGVYRLMTSDHADAAGGFYCANEFDLTPLLASGRRLLELGRSCLHPQYRGGMAMYQLWNGLASYVAERKCDVLFGAASFAGTDVAALAEPLSLLQHRHLAPEALRVTVRPQETPLPDLIDDAKIDRVRAMLAVPALIKAYLRLGGFVGQGAFVDHAFKTTDVCLILDTARLNPAQAAIYTGTTKR